MRILRCFRLLGPFLLLSRIAQADDVAKVQQRNSSYGVTVCADSVIEVEDLSVVCDSPGTYYYGSGKYRNSPTCVAGDKAKVYLKFYIADHDTIYQAGNKALINIDVSSGGWFGESKTVYENADLCSLSSLKVLSGGPCPYEGYYRVRSQFFWGKTDYDKYGGNTYFYPYPSVGFKSSGNKEVYDFGGANTNLCRGSTFVTWTDGIRVTYANALSNFVKTFGLLLLTVASLGLFLWFISVRPTSYADAKQKFRNSVKTSLPKLVNFRRKKINEIEDDEDEFDFRKIQTGGGQDLVDF